MADENPPPSDSRNRSDDRSTDQEAVDARPAEGGGTDGSTSDDAETSDPPAKAYDDSAIASAGTDTSSERDPNPADEGDAADPAPVPAPDSDPADDADGASTRKETDEGDATPAVSQSDHSSEADTETESRMAGAEEPPSDVQEYTRFSKMDGATYERVNGFLRDRTYITAREWAIARLCADFRTETGVEMTKIGDHLPELVPFMTDTYSPQAVNQARHSFEDKVTKAGATFLYGAMCDFFTAEELDDLMYEVTEVAKFLLEVEGAELTVDEELETEEMIMEVMRDVRHSSASLRADEVVPESCPHCGGDLSTEQEPTH